MKWLFLALVALTCLDFILSHDGFDIEETGCPKIFKKRCHCGKQRYHLWKPQRNDTYVTNCTNSE